jgi:hypothetical protein
MRFDLREHGLEGTSVILIIHTTMSTELLPGPLEVGYPALSSGFEKHFVEALQTLGVNLASEPVLCLFIFVRIRKMTLISLLEM